MGIIIFVSCALEACDYGWCHSSQTPRFRRPAKTMNITYHYGSNIVAYLPASSVDAQRCQKGIEDHVTGLYVDGRLSFPHRAKIPS